MGALESKFWTNLCRELGCGHLTGRQFAPIERQRAMKAELGGVFATKDAEEWFDLLRDKDCCAMPVRTIQEAFDSGVFRERRVGIKPLLSSTPASEMLCHPPRLGEHSVEILRKSGLDMDEIEHLRRCGVIQCTDGTMTDREEK